MTSHSKQKRKEQSNTLQFKFVGLCLILIGIVIGAGLKLIIDSSTSKARPLQGTSDVLSLEQLLNTPYEDLIQIDIARINLACAAGLPGSENLNMKKCLTTLDQWVEHIRIDTEQRIGAYYQNRNKYDNSINLFKVVTMILCLKNHLGVNYNLDIMKRTEFFDSRDVFIHGCVMDKKQGGCISIPILCVAVGRQLGYPLKLVLTREHVFFRWDAGKEVFNMEACCEGCDTHPDDYYKTWPRKVTEEEIKDNHLLVSLTPTEELGLFLETRGHCLFDAGRIAEAQIMYAHAYRLMPVKVRLAHMDRVIRMEMQKKKKL